MLLTTINNIEKKMQMSKGIRWYNKFYVFISQRIVEN
jgi:hypothetical protein